jgi:hypothetical protein
VEKELWEDLKDDEKGFILFVLINETATKENYYNFFTKPRALIRKGWIQRVKKGGRFFPCQLTEHAKKEIDLAGIDGYRDYT